MTVTVFSPGVKAIVVDQLPSEETVVLTPLTVTEDPGSALPDIVVLEPVTVELEKESISRSGAVTSFEITTLRGSETLYLDLITRI